LTIKDKVLPEQVVMLIKETLLRVLAIVSGLHIDCILEHFLRFHDEGEVIHKQSDFTTNALTRLRTSSDIRST
jgi:hypothetical protein